MSAKFESMLLPACSLNKCFLNLQKSTGNVYFFTLKKMFQSKYQKEEWFQRQCIWKSQGETEGAHYRTWVCKEKQWGEWRNAQEERTEIKSHVRGKSSNRLVALNVSAHIHKTFDSWKLRHLRSPELCLSISLFIYQSVSLSYWERRESEGGKWFPHNILLRLTLYPLIYTVAEGRRTNAFSLFTSLCTHSNTHLGSK